MVHMGMIFNAVCQKCKHQFKASEGGGMLFIQLRCNKCGQAKDYNILEELAHINFRHDDCESQLETMGGKCDCGGLYKLRAKPRCPNCGSDNYEMAPDSELLLFD